MIVDCKEFEKLLSEGISELTDAAAAHLRGCPRLCRGMAGLAGVGSSSSSTAQDSGKAPSSGRASGSPWRRKLRRQSEALVAPRRVSQLSLAVAGGSRSDLSWFFPDSADG